jgi:FkbM family methyltransferase
MIVEVNSNASVALEKPTFVRRGELLRAVVQWINAAILSRLGLRLTALSRRTRNFTSFFSHLEKLGFRPKNVIDVGVEWGTQDLYEAFPDAKFYVVEPLPEFESAIRQLAASYKVEYVIAAAGPRNGAITGHSHPRPKRESMRHRPSIMRRDVRAVTLDEHFGDCINGPCLLKVDADGNELGVLDGAERVLALSDVVILETRTTEYVDDLLEFSGVVKYMNDRGFRLFEVLNGGYRSLRGASKLLELWFFPAPRRRRHACGATLLFISCAIHSELTLGGL